MPASASAALVRVDTLTAPQIKAHLAAYPKHISSFTTRTISLQDPQTNLKRNLAELDRLYNIALPSTIIEHSRLMRQRNLIKLVAWVHLRSRPNSDLDLEAVRKNTTKSIKGVNRRAADFLNVLGNAGSWSSNAAVIVERCMHILCELHGVGVKEASAIVAAWTPAGIHMSEELVKNILGVDTQPKDDWEFFRDFYGKAMKVLEKMQAKGVTSGREMEKLAWVVYHSRKKTNAGEKKVCGECGTLVTNQDQSQNQKQKQTQKQKQKQDSKQKQNQKQNQKQSGKQNQKHEQKQIPKQTQNQKQQQNQTLQQKQNQTQKQSKAKEAEGQKLEKRRKRKEKRLRKEKENLERKKREKEKREQQQRSQRPIKPLPTKTGTRPTSDVDATHSRPPLMSSWEDLATGRAPFYFHWIGTQCFANYSQPMPTSTAGISTSLQHYHYRSLAAQPQAVIDLTDSDEDGDRPLTVQTPFFHRCIARECFADYPLFAPTSMAAASASQPQHNHRSPAAQPQDDNINLPDLVDGEDHCGLRTN